MLTVITFIQVGKVANTLIDVFSEKALMVNKTTTLIQHANGMVGLGLGKTNFAIHIKSK